MLLKSLLTLLCFIPLFGCGIFNGTNTGNPGAHNFVPPDLPMLFTDYLNGQICLTIRYCDSNANFYSCMKDNNTNSQIPVELKIDADYPTLNLLREAEALQKVAINKASASACVAAIQKISCTSNEFKEVYNANDPDNFEKTFLLLRLDSQCGNIYLP